MTPEQIERERMAFEATPILSPLIFTRSGMPPPTRFYTSIQTETAWLAWLARADLMPQDPDVGNMRAEAHAALEYARKRAEEYEGRAAGLMARTQVLLETMESASPDAARYKWLLETLKAEQAEADLVPMRIADLQRLEAIISGGICSASFGGKHLPLKEAMELLHKIMGERAFLRERQMNDTSEPSGEKT